MVQDFNRCSHMAGCFQCLGCKPCSYACIGNSLRLPALADRVRRSSHEVDWGSLGLVGDPIVNRVRPAVDKAATAQLFQIVLHGAPTGGMSAATLATRAVLSETPTFKKMHFMWDLMVAIALPIDCAIVTGLSPSEVAKAILASIGVRSKIKNGTQDFNGHGLVLAASGYFRSQNNDQSGLQGLFEFDVAHNRGLDRCLRAHTSKT